MACGRADVDQFLDELTSQQFDELLAFNSLEPIGTERLTWTIASGLAAVINLWASGGSVEPWQIVPGAEEPTREGDPRLILEMINGNARRSGCQPDGQ